tara:strand:+ start:248 stop:466 length:219 start_codon:yes stop_codon:yes gene_type:complete
MIYHIYSFLSTPMNKTEYDDEQFDEMIEDAFVNIKEACLRLQERTKCSNEVVMNMLNEVSKFYILQDDKKQK